MQEFDLEIIHIPRRENNIADTLSRQHPTRNSTDQEDGNPKICLILNHDDGSNSEEWTRMLRESQAADENLADSLEEFPEKYHIREGLIRIDQGPQERISNPVERVMRELGKVIRAYFHKKQTQWDRILTRFEKIVNNTAHSSTGCNPSDLHPELQLSLELDPTLYPEEPEQTNLEQKIEEVSKHLKRKAAVRKIQADKHQEAEEYEIGTKNVNGSFSVNQVERTALMIEAEQSTFSTAPTTEPNASKMATQKEYSLKVLDEQEEKLKQEIKDLLLRKRKGLLAERRKKERIDKLMQLKYDISNIPDEYTDSEGEENIEKFDKELAEIFGKQHPTVDNITMFDDKDSVSETSVNPTELNIPQTTQQNVEERLREILDINEESIPETTKTESTRESKNEETQKATKPQKRIEKELQKILENQRYMMPSTSSEITDQNRSCNKKRRTASITQKSYKEQSSDDSDEARMRYKSSKTRRHWKQEEIKRQKRITESPILGTRPSADQKMDTDGEGGMQPASPLPEKRKTEERAQTNG
ncbi:uncharacterized protein [Linepithema humile]|uniref:uncharacterized protein n=1 Tax=Linepithema humile TaxID=83485 RepID=UPI00351F345C